MLFHGVLARLVSQQISGDWQKLKGPLVFKWNLGVEDLLVGMGKAGINWEGHDGKEKKLESLACYSLPEESAFLSFLHYPLNIFYWRDVQNEI